MKVEIAEIIMENQKLMFFLSKIGKIMKNTREGITIQKIELDSWLILAGFFVSTYIQIIAKIDVKGREARTAPHIEYLFPTSEINQIITAVKSIFVRLYMTSISSPYT